MDQPSYRSFHIEEYISIKLLYKRRRGLLGKCIFHVRIQAAKTSFQTFYWSSRTASLQLIQWKVRINRFRKLGPVHKIHIHLEATSPFIRKLVGEKGTLFRQFSTVIDYGLIPPLPLKRQPLLFSSSCADSPLLVVLVLVLCMMTNIFFMTWLAFCLGPLKTGGGGIRSIKKLKLNEEKKDMGIIHCINLEIYRML